MDGSSCSPKKGTTLGTAHLFNLTVSYLQLYGSNQRWKTEHSYCKRFLAETVRVQVKKLLGGTWNLRSMQFRLVETDGMIKASNKLIRLGMPKTKAIV